VTTAKTALLAARAVALARPAAVDATTDGDGIEALVFQVGDEEMAMPLAAIVAIARAGSIAPLPRVVRPVYGVSAWRGRPLTVLALAPGRPGLGADARLLVLGSGSRAALAVVVDAVHEVRRVDNADLSPVAGGPRARYALGVTSTGLFVVDGEALLHPETLIT
jgi:chemotaxis signal transduction protein